MKSLSKEKIDILQLLWSEMRPLKLKDIATKVGLKTRSTNAHLWNLKRAGYVSSTGEGSYILTGLGKEILGFPRVDRELARKLLSKTSQEKAFHFHLGIGKPLNMSADSLPDFCEKIRLVDPESIDFHSKRGDFELWFHFLGDAELSKRLRVIRKSNLSGEALRDTIHMTVKYRCEELQRLALTEAE
ncbi:MAG: hypothetical protein ACTSVF_01010 [Candidatus Asgardarchaeia archaeon]